MATLVVYRLRLLATAAIVAATAGCTSSPPRPRRLPEPRLESAAIEPGEVESDLIEAHNRLRAEHGLAALERHPALEGAARNHAADMASTLRMSHRGSDGSTLGGRVDLGASAFKSAGENVAQGQRSVELVLASWMKSPPHRRNILGSFSHIGTGYAVDKNGTPYWCVTFGKVKTD